MKKFAMMILILIVGLVVSLDVVKAAESQAYFTSDNGIELTEKEYNFILEVYGEDYAKKLNQNQYDLINTLDINNREVTTVTTEDRVLPTNRAIFVETQYKRLSISASCGSDGLCSIIVVLRWLAIPSTRSYDNMGVRWNGTVSLQSTRVSTAIEEDDVSRYCVNYKHRTNGFGCTFKLSSTAKEHLYMTQVFMLQGSGTVYASYQHASKALTKDAAQQYRLSIAGYGAVFDFYGDAIGKYDGMNGVEVKINK